MHEIFLRVIGKCIIASMFRLYLLMWHFIHFPDNGYWANHNDAIQRNKFVWFLLQNHFIEDWRDTIRRLYFFVIRGDQSEEQSEEVRRRFKIQLRCIEDLVDKALHDGYIFISERNNLVSHCMLQTNWKGRNFLKPLPFIEASAREFGYISSITATLIATSIISVVGTLIVLR